MQATTGQLVTAAQAGDEGAREELFSRAARLAHARAYCLLRDPDAAEDAAQEALIAAYVALGDLRDPRSFAGWLRRIVDRAVAKHNQPGHADPAILDPDPAYDQPTPHDLLERREAEAAVARAVATLPPRSRLVVELFYFDGLTCAEVADFLDVSTDSVKATLHRSRERLRRSVTTMAISATGTKWRSDAPTSSICMGDEVFGNRWWGYDPDTWAIYWGVYPNGSPREAAQAEGIDEGKVDELVEELMMRLLVAREKGRLTCKAPIIDDLDREVLRPWVDRTAGSLIGAMDELAAEAEGLASTLPTEAGRQRGAPIALLGGIIGRAHYAGHHSLEPRMLDAGDFGKYLFAWVMGNPGPPTVNVACSVRSMTPPPGGVTLVMARPATPRDATAIPACFSAHPSAGTEAGWPSQAAWAFLVSLEVDAVTRVGLPERLARCELDSEDVSLADDLVTLGWAEWEGDRLRSRIPVGPAEPWAPFWERLDVLGAKIADSLHEPDLERRVSRCSFRDCYLPNVHLGCLLLVSEAVSREIRRRDLATIPDDPDPAWGYLLLH